jgi:mannitol-specific phosphotransferase system IIBC component
MEMLMVHFQAEVAVVVEQHLLQLVAVLLEAHKVVLVD